MKSKITPEIAELLGAHTGDGTLYKTGSSVVWELRGALNEKDYYVNNICPLIKKIFGFEIKSKFRNNGYKGVGGIQTCKKQIINTILTFGFKQETKTYGVFVPKFIFDSEVEIKRSFVRGLFDTDGCLRFDKINNSRNYTYPRIEFCFASLKLRDSLKKLLDGLGFKPFAWNNTPNSFSLCLAGKDKLKRWINEIKPKNPKHLNKYCVWNKKGIYQKD